MNLPKDIEIKILDRFQNSRGGFKKEYEELSKRYRENSKNKQVDNDKQALSYAIGRMPATFSVCTKVLKEIENFNFTTACDYGAGTGATALAIAETLEVKSISCFEYSQNMLDLGKFLTESYKNISWQNFNIITDKLISADLVTCSYLLNEVEDNLQEVTQKLFSSFNKALVLIEAGTPHGFEIIKKVRELALQKGLYIFAPCTSEKPCPIKNNDWCAFTSRVNRTNLLQQIKQGTSSYEDENYSYLIITKEPNSYNYARVLRHPEILKGHINLKVCQSGEIREITIAKSMNEKYKCAKKINCGDKFEC